MNLETITGTNLPMEIDVNAEFDEETDFSTNRVNLNVSFAIFLSFYTSFQYTVGNGFVSG